MKAFFAELEHLLSRLVAWDSMELNTGIVKVTYSNELRQQAADVYAIASAKRVLFAPGRQEIWEYAFKSLHQLRQMLVELQGKFTASGSSEIRACLAFSAKAIAVYTATHESSYILHMQDARRDNLAPLHWERNWPQLQQAAEDLVELREAVGKCLAVLRAFAEDGKVTPWDDYGLYIAKNWARYASGRELCATCGKNMYYFQKEMCRTCSGNNAFFRYTDYESSKITVAGSFNNWDIETTRLTRGEGGVWETGIKVNPGTYFYKFVVDGAWKTDPHNPETCVDAEGNINSMITIGA